jgi:hypothetical protein
MPVLFVFDGKILCLNTTTNKRFDCTSFQIGMVSDVLSFPELTRPDDLYCAIHVLTELILQDEENEPKVLKSMYPNIHKKLEGYREKFLEISLEWDKDFSTGFYSTANLCDILKRPSLSE